MTTGLGGKVKFIAQHVVYGPRGGSQRGRPLAEQSRGLPGGGGLRGEEKGRRSLAHAGRTHPRLRAPVPPRTLGRTRSSRDGEAGREQGDADGRGAGVTSSPWGVTVTLGGVQERELVTGSHRHLPACVLRDCRPAGRSGQQRPRGTVSPVSPENFVLVTPARPLPARPRGRAGTSQGPRGRLCVSRAPRGPHGAAGRRPLRTHGSGQAACCPHAARGAEVCGPAALTGPLSAFRHRNAGPRPSRGSLCPARPVARPSAFPFPPGPLTRVPRPAPLSPLGLCRPGSSLWWWTGLCARERLQRGERGPRP